MKASRQLSYGLGILISFFLIPDNRLYAQDEQKIRITSPFDRLTVTNAAAEGNLKTGTLEITMDFQNNYEKLANVSLSIGGFDGLGVITDNGKKYKIHTNENLIGTKDINKGYLRIPFVQFGNKKFDWVTMVQQDIPQGEKRTLTIRIDKFDKKAKVITDFHVRCILALNYSHEGDKLYQVENLNIEWKK